MAVNKAKAQCEGNQRVIFKILDTAGTPTVVNVCPSIAAGDISIVDTAAGTYDVTIKNFLGPAGATNIQATSYIISTFASVTARSYSGADLSLTIVVNTDGGTDTDSAVDVIVEAY